MFPLFNFIETLDKYFVQVFETLDKYFVQVLETLDKYIVQVLDFVQCCFCFLNRLVWIQNFNQLGQDFKVLFLWVLFYIPSCSNCNHLVYCHYVVH